MKEYIGVEKIEGPLVFLKTIPGVAYGELIELTIEGSRKRLGKVIRIDQDMMVAQVFEGTSGISTTNTTIKYTGKPFTLAVSKDLLGRSFNGVGHPIDGGGPLFTARQDPINGRPINPVAREYPRNFIQTGISAIDGLMTLIRGQKLPIFSASGLPHRELAAQIVAQSKLSQLEGQSFAVVFAAIGMTKDDAYFFKNHFEETGTIDKIVTFYNYADDPIAQRISTPRCALTAAEYLAFEEGMHVLVVMLDITSYCEALREVSSAREEVPSRKGYPGYLYSDLASLYERAGMLKSKKGSITFIPILTMPSDDITHPIPDLTGYITEGQIVLSRDLHNSGVYPPISVLPSLSRLMKDGIGKGYTREDHQDVTNQLFSSYSRVQEVRALAQIIGEEDLAKADQRHIEFGRKFEQKLIQQGFTENRSIGETLDLGWQVLNNFEEEDLDRLSHEVIAAHIKGEVDE